MKPNKIFLLAGIALMSVFATSCSDDDDYTAGKETGAYNVYFKGESNLTMNLTDMSFDITVARSNKNGELTVPIKKIRVPDCFTNIPESVTFANGDSVKTITVNVTDSMKPFVSYILDLQIPEEYTNQYKTQTVYPALNMNIHKEDYKPFAKVSYYYGFFDATDNVDVEYSKYMDLFRFKNLVATGYDFYFYWDQVKDSTSVFKVTDANGNELTSAFESGYVHAKYGMVSATWDNTQFTGYDPKDDTFYVPYTWTVSAGSFGTAYDTFKFTSLY
jgi:hypothetical protein